MFPSDLLSRDLNPGESVEINNGWVEVSHSGDIQFTFGKQVGFKIANIVRYLTNEQLYTLIRAGEAALAVSDFNASRNASVSVLSQTGVRRVEVVFYRDSKDNILAVLDDESISPTKKFAAVISILSVCRWIPFQIVKEIITAQVDPKDVEYLTFERFKMFLYPHFADTNEEGWTATEWSISTVELQTMVRYTGFLAYSEKDETYAQYLKRCEGNFFKPIFNNEVMRNVQNRIRALAQGKIESKISDLTAPQAKRFVHLYLMESSVFTKFFKDRIRQGIRMAVELPEFNPASLSQVSVMDLTKILTKDEILRLDNEVKSDPDSPFIPAWLPKSSMWLVAYYYINGGYGAALELFRVVSADSEYEKFFITDTDNQSASIRSLTQMQLSKFIRAIDPKHKDMPLEWAITVL